MKFTTILLQMKKNDDVHPSTGSLNLNLHCDLHDLRSAVLANLSLKLALVVQCLNIISAADAAAADHDVWDGAALGSLGEEVLDRHSHLDLVKLDDVWWWLDLVDLSENVLGLCGVWAVGLGEDED